MPKKKRSFEESVSELEDLVDELEQGSLTLEEVLKKYKRSMELIKSCRADLDSADKEICELLMMDEKGKQQPVDIKTKETNHE